uniref:Uncharacterized protein n=1 Tax=Arundo donax TaxID=35708 RepID=A0A0A9BU94_ARUDO
MLCSSSFAGGR